MSESCNLEREKRSGKEKRNWSVDDGEKKHIWDELHAGKATQKRSELNARKTFLKKIITN